MRATFDNLPEDVAASLSAAIGEYPCRSIVDHELKLLKKGLDELLFDAEDLERPLVFQHSNGRKSLYLNEKWLSCIKSMERSDSDAMLRFLYDRVERCSQQYIYLWEVGDILLWDNMVVAHKALPCDPGDQKITWRIVVRRRHEQQRTERFA
jgi:alpha-ketoglutarate-dependent taurine dioxygenase